MFDMGGQGQFREFWEYFFMDAQGVMFVVDSSDRERLCNAKDELKKILTHKNLENKPILVFANKQDLDKSVPPKELSAILKMDKISGREWNLIGSNALKGEGIEEGINWLMDRILS
eukprot:CAMPEP_0117429178 /NCGR_PEP_ID=MMETSP0758-20121206/8755_1 /TAXON_ID=63605 /ORGANISM="Percolomonas cosmopolitus, Strain AE-1 (ATCC 50343)" /LENGTH=115 /DNA_ID=CAMNT_0005216013 /DNA_START=315 /DNA_END=662 /DNA_ORIENTATION=+